MVCAIIQYIDRDNPSGWIHDPVLPDACSLVQVELCEAVNSMSGVGGDFDNHVRSAADPMPVNFFSVTYNHQVWLYYGRNILWGVSRFFE